MAHLRRVTSKKSYITKWILLTVFACSVGVLGSLFATTQTLAYTGPSYGGIPEDILGAPYNAAPYSVGYTPPQTQTSGYFGNGNGSPSISMFDGKGGRDCYNGSSWYGSLTNSWVYSSAGSQIDGNPLTGNPDQSIKETQGQPNIQLYLANMLYTCYKATLPGTTASNGMYSPSSPYNNGPVNADSVSDKTLLSNGAELGHQSQFWVQSSVVQDQSTGAPAGSISCLNGQKMVINSQTNTRYWYWSSTTSAPGCSGGNGFTLKLNNNVSQTVNLYIYEYGTSTFWDSATGNYDDVRCMATNKSIASYDPNGDPTTAGNDPSQCVAMQIKLTLNIVVPSSTTASGCPPFLSQGYDYHSVQSPLPYQGKNNAAPSPTSFSQSTSSPAPQPYEEDDPVKVQYKGAPDQSLTDDSPGIQNSNANALPSWISEVDSLSGSVTMDYSNFYNNYPYDQNKPKIGYDSYYNKIMWTPKLTGYTCRPNGNGGYDPSGYKGNPSVCYYQAQSSFNTADPSCQSGWTYYPAGALGPGTPAGCWQQQGPGGSCNFTAADLAPYGGVGWCYGGAGTPPPPACWPGASPADSGPDSNGNCYYNAPTANYTWTAGPAKLTPEASTIDGILMPACFNRTYSITPIDSLSLTGHASALSWGGDIDNPSSLAYSGNVMVHYDVTPSGVTNQGPYYGTFKQATQVSGLNTQIQVQIYTTYGNAISSSPVATPYSVTRSYIYSGNYQENTNDYTQPHDVYTPVSWGEVVALASHGGSLYYGDMACVDLQTDPSQGEVSPDYTSATPWSYQNASVGLLNEQPDPNGPGTGPEDPWPDSTSAVNNINPRSVCSTPLRAKPYLKVYGGDVLAGVSAANVGSCVNSAAPAETWNTGSVSAYNGSGTTLAALIGGSDNAFASAKVNGTGASPPIGLTFANNTGGGGFGPSVTDCAPDYYSQGASSATGSFNGGDVGALTSGSYSVDTTAAGGPVVITGGTLSGNQHVTLYVKGSNPVVISGNIGYSGIAPTSIPSFSIVTNGTPIDIANSVTQLAGNYIAEGGTIDDCYNVSTSGNLFYTSPAYSWDSGQPSATHSNTCGYKLTVQGSFVAKDVELKRTAYNASGSTSTYHDSTGDSLSPGGNQAAEEFDFSPLQWLSAPQTSNAPVQAITSVPPVL